MRMRIFDSLPYEVRRAFEDCEENLDLLSLDRLSQMLPAHALIKVIQNSAKAWREMDKEKREEQWKLQQR